ncbi:ABC transporter substrate-binding protein [Tropicimonas isoalkanivorans]|uniref:Multiple sugar transport system substrate-binding protein n=1 Tax=Tropicimonas isoalkanivorans TaxID=441112 RepID=A0A1I1M401_9RHOB|nr:sugar ABC transporter substrate-binding protein [Tropicimonas isoalkanivorans]SFC80217.1 multiple sugar transport system substrate-binding protein [Tropicimonas isoalkanivorans]
MNLKSALCAVSALVSVTATAAMAEELTIATVNNADMIIMQKLSPKWEEATGNTLNWVVLEENVLRQRVTTDIATKGGSFDVITIGAYEAPIWGAQDWLVALDDLGDDYDYEDIFEPVRNGLSANGKLYAVPFYAESSFTFYRTDLFEAAGIEKPTEQITYDQFGEIVAKVHDPDNGIYGTCQRGKAGWGENMAFVGPMVNAFGGRWFDEEWNPTIDSPEWHNAINYYVDLMNNYGPPGASSNGHNENRALFADGKCATWVDATSAAGYIFNPNESTVADKTDFFQAPKQETSNGTGWFWAWALGIPTSSTKVDVAKDFVAWATSKEYIELVGESEGWVAAPPGTRTSTYENEAYLEAAPFAKTVETSILAADPSNPTRDPVPYTGIQFVAIPEFQGIGNYVGQQVSAALAGQQSVDQALANSQQFAVREMTKAGYIK